MWLEDLLVDEQIEEKLWIKHRVTMDEVWDACAESEPYVERARGGLYLVLGRTGAGRYLAVVLAHRGRRYVEDRVGSGYDGRRTATIPAEVSMPEVPDGLDDLSLEQRSAVEAFDAGEDIGTGERIALEVRQPLTKVVPIRMSEEQWELLAREARELGTRPTTLLRIWVMERLRNAGRAAPDPAAADVGELVAALKASVDAMQTRTVVRRRKAG